MQRGVPVANSPVFRPLLHAKIGTCEHTTADLRGEPRTHVSSEVRVDVSDEIHEQVHADVPFERTSIEERRPNQWSVSVLLDGCDALSPTLLRSGFLRSMHGWHKRQ